MKEIWKDIPKYNGYQVSNLGRIKSLPKKHNLKNGNYYISKEKIMKLHKNNKGYLRVVINNEKHFVHRLVASAFIINDENKAFINHKDCNPLNNRVDNLEWCTLQENVDYMIKLGRNIRTKKWLNNLHKSQEQFYKKVKGINESGDIIILKCINEAKKYGMSPGSICCCCKKKYKSYKGYKWEYINE